MDHASAALDNGVLTVTLPVAEAAQTRRLSISGTDGAWSVLPGCGFIRRGGVKIAPAG